MIWKNMTVIPNRWPQGALVYHLHEFFCVDKSNNSNSKTFVRSFVWKKIVRQQLYVHHIQNLSTLEIGLNRFVWFWNAWKPQLWVLSSFESIAIFLLSIWRKSRKVKKQFHWSIISFSLFNYFNNIWRLQASKTFFISKWNRSSDNGTKIRKITCRKRLTVKLQNHFRSCHTN